MNGYGLFFWKDGRIYKGAYKEDKKHLFGMYYKPDGKKYEGNWNNGSQSGIGKYTKKDGSYKLGDWNENNLVEKYEEDNEKYSTLMSQIEEDIENTNLKVDEIIDNLRQCFSIYLPNSQIEEFLEA